MKHTCEQNGFTIVTEAYSFRPCEFCGVVIIPPEVKVEQECPKCGKKKFTTKRSPSVKGVPGSSDGNELSFYKECLCCGFKIHGIPYSERLSAFANITPGLRRSY